MVAAEAGRKKIADNEQALRGKVEDSGHPPARAFSTSPTTTAWQARAQWPALKHRWLGRNGARGRTGGWVCGETATTPYAPVATVRRWQSKYLAEQGTVRSRQGRRRS